MRITESLSIENDRRVYRELYSDCETYGLKKRGLTRSDYNIYITFFTFGQYLRSVYLVSFFHQIITGNEIVMVKVMST